MNFRRGRHREEPEINFIPLIDVLMVILIFLMVTTTYSKFTELQINLPEATADKAPERPQVINVAVDAAGKYAINNIAIAPANADSFALALQNAAKEASIKEPIIAIGADAGAQHQAVINIMEAARLAGYTKVSFTTQAKAAK